jgi:hypothetical protein
LNQKGSCLTVKGNVLDITGCNTGDANQSFTFGGAPAANNNNNNQKATTAATTAASKATTAAASNNNNNQNQNCAPPKIITVTAGADNNQAKETKASAAPPATTQAANPAGAIGNPTTEVPVSRAGGKLNPSAAAEAQQRDNTATRAFSSVSIKAPNGQCLFIDPTAGDFRQNLIPVSLVTCGGTPNEKWDIITAGKHNNKPNSAIIVSSLVSILHMLTHITQAMPSNITIYLQVQGCISFDGRRQAGDTVTLFSCGGRGDGGKSILALHETPNFIVPHKS